MFDFLNAKPVLVGLHLGFAILAIDGFLWLFGEILSRSENRFRIIFSGMVGMSGFILSWIVGGYYYVKFYGPLVKPIIKAGSAPWAHGIAMEAKEHIFLFIIPLAFVAFFSSFLSPKTIDEYKLRKPILFLIILIVLIGLSIGAMGFIISSAARWA